MKKHVNGLALCLTVIMLCSLSGCWNWRELNTLAIVLGIGIDKAEAPDKYELTAQIVKNEESESSSSSTSKNSGKSSYLNIHNTGDDIFAIVRGITLKTSRKLYIAHNQVIVIGEALAKDGIRESLDMFMRDHEGRMTTRLFVAKGKAFDLLNVEPTVEQSPATEISKLMDGREATSEMVQLTLAGVVSDLISDTKSIVAPYLDIVSDNGEQKIAVAGSAVFKDDRLVGQLDEKQTRGYLWVIGKVKSGIITVSILDEEAGVEIKKASAKITPQINGDGTVKIKVKVLMQGTLGDQTGKKSLNRVKNIEVLEDAVSDEIKKEIQDTLDKTRVMGTDIYGFGERVNKKYPKKWKIIKGSWDKQFKELDVEINVKSTILGGGRIIDPIYPKKELPE